LKNIAKYEKSLIVKHHEKVVFFRWNFWQVNEKKKRIDRRKNIKILFGQCNVSRVMKITGQKNYDEILREKDFFGY
jgi:hypothetical protein